MGVRLRAQPLTNSSSILKKIAIRPVIAGLKEIIYITMIIVRGVGGIIIRDITIKIADEKDLEFIEVMQSLGVNGNVARLITYLASVDEGSSRDIEVATGLRQPGGKYRHANPAREELGQRT